MKKLLVIFFAIVSVFALAFGLTACGGGGGSSVNGTYYLYENGNYDKSQYITINSGKWTDDDDASGTYTLNGESIVFYAEIFGSNEEMFSGTLSGGTLTISVFGANKTYCKEGKAPSSDNGGTDKPSANEYTVTYDANGGTFSNETTSTVQKANGGTTLTAPASPSRTNYSFGGWATDKNGNTLWKFATDTVTSNLTLYAVWNEESAVIMSVDGASITDRTINMFVSSDVEYVSLANKVVCSSDSTWRLYYDRLGLTEIPTKIAAQTSGSLGNGDNLFYIVVTSSDGTQVNTYELTVYRSFSVSVNYYDNKSELLKTEKIYTGYEYTISYTPTITGYAFNYWKDSNGKQSALSFIPYSTVNLYADCTANTYKITLSANGGSVSSTEKTVTYDKSYSLPVPTRTGYSFTGWYLSSTQITDEKGASLENWTYTADKSLTAKWSANSYTLTVAASDSKAGSVTGGGDYYYDSSVTVTATTNSGYTFLGWYDKSGKQLSANLSYTFKMGLTSTYTAKWITCPVTLSRSNTSAGTVIGVEKTIAGALTTITAKTNSGYTWIGWYNGETLLTDEISYTFTMPSSADDAVTYTAKWTYYTLTTTTNDSEAGTYTVKNSVKTTVGANVSLTASTNVGYTWLGWYNGETLLTDELSYTFAMPAESVSYTAKWCKVTLVTNSTEAGTISSLTGTYKPGDEAMVTTTTNMGYTWLGWYNGETLLTGDLSYTFAMPAESATYTAKWQVVEEMEVFHFTSTPTTCIITGITDKTVTEIVVPDYVTLISEGAFSVCSKLESITLPFVGGSVKTASDTYQYPLGYIFGASSYDGGTATEQYYYGGSTSSTTSTTYYIPSSLKSITVTGGDILYGAFSNCDSLTSVTIPDNIARIGDYAFYYCDSLTSITIPDSVTSIGNRVFIGCHSLTSVTIGNDVESIGSYAFAFCSNLTSITIPDNVTSIGSYAFCGCSSLDSITIPDSVTSIGGCAFYDCTSLTSVTIPDGVTSISDSAFYRCRSLTSVTIPDSVTSIGDSAFWYCSSLTSITIPDIVTSIGSSAFEGCSSLTSITIPNSVTYIGDEAFRECSNLTEINYNATKCLDLLEGNYVFYKAGQSGTGITVTIGANVKKIPACLFCSYESDFVNSCVPKITSVIFEEGSVCESIGNSAFEHCYSLISVTIPDSVTSIGNSAFSGCLSLTSVTFENTSGWKVSSSSSSSSSTTLSSSSLANTSTAAKYLTSTYRSYWWKRS